MRRSTSSEHCPTTAETWNAHVTRAITESQDAQLAHEPWNRFRIVRMQTKGDKRIAGDIKIAVYGIFGINTAGVIVGNYLDRRVGRVARVRELLAS